MEDDVEDTTKTIQLPIKRTVQIDVLEDNMLVVHLSDEPSGTFCTSARQFGEVLRKRLAHPFAAERSPRKPRQPAVTKPAKK